MDKIVAKNIFLDELDNMLELKSSMFPQYKGKIREFAFDKFDIVLSDVQVKIANEVLNNKITNVPAAHGIGKSFLIAIVVYYWVFVEGGQCFTTAPTNSQLEENIWNPINILWDKHKSKFSGARCLTKELKHTNQARAFGRTGKDYDSNTIQGKHAHKLLLIEDEAGGITPQIDLGIKSCATGPGSKIWRVGNPVEPYTAFYYNCLTSSLRIPVWEHENVSWAYEIREKESPWHRLKKDVEKEILYKDEKGKVFVKNCSEWPSTYPKYRIDSAVDIQWIEEMRQDYGEGSDEWLGRVEAIFPISVANAVISIPKLRLCRSYDSIYKQLSTIEDIYLGVDIGGGSDPHCISYCRGNNLLDYQTYPTFNDGDDLERLGTYIKEYIHRIDDYMHRNIHIGYDATGEGSGAETAITNVLINEPYFDSIKFYRIKTGSSSSDPTVYANLKAEQLGTFALFVISNDFSIFLDDEKYQKLEQEIAFVTKSYTRRYRAMQVISKDDYKKKTGFSHDITDSIMNAFSIYNNLVEAKEKNKVDEISSIMKSLRSKK
jgi:hypothetical protein